MSYPFVNSYKLTKQAGTLNASSPARGSDVKKPARGGHGRRSVWGSRFLRGGSGKRLLNFGLPIIIMAMVTLIPLRMSDSHFLRIVREVAKDTARMKLSRHAKERMEGRGFSISQVFACIRRGAIYEPVHQDVRGDWKCTLRLVWAGDDIRVAIALKRNDQGIWIAVLTVF